MSIDQLMRAGDFAGAIAQLDNENPEPGGDPGQLLMKFNLEVRVQRFADADASLLRVVMLAPQLARNMAELRSCAHAEATVVGRATDPKLAGSRAGLGLPPPHAVSYIQAAVCRAQGDHAGAVAALAAATAATPATPGTLTRSNGAVSEFAGFVDSDDLTGPTLIVYRGDDVIDLSFSELRKITFLGSQTSFDTMWMPTEIITTAGKAVVGRVPAFYAGTGVAEHASERTGQMTTWNRDHGYAVAVGQRDFKVMKSATGYATVGMLQMREIAFAPRAAVRPAPAAATDDADPPPAKKGFWARLFGG